jgi:hypothetical protein
MARTDRAAMLDRVVRSSTETPIEFGRVVPLGTELQRIATDVLQGLQYSFLAAAAHPEVRFPFGSLEEAFQDAIALRPAERRWVYHAQARQIARAPREVRQAAFGRYGELGLDEFGRMGLLDAVERLPALVPCRFRPSIFAGTRPPQGTGAPLAIGPRRTILALYITQVSCLDQTTPEASKGEEIALGGLALDAAGNAVKIGQFMVRDDFENGVLKDYGVPGRKFCEFAVSEALTDSPRAYGVTAFLAVADRAGFSEGLAGALVKAGPILRRAVEAPVVAQVVGRVVERFVLWLTEAFQDDVFPPGLALAGLHTGLSANDLTGPPGQLVFANQRGRYRVSGHWRVTHR